MPSPEAEAILSRMRAEMGAPLKPLEVERAEWEAAMKGVRPSEGTLVSGVSLNGVPCEWVERADSDGLVVLLVHGGGFSAGSPRTHRSFAAQLAQASHARVLVPDYALAPEHPFPAAIEDLVAVYAALAEQGVAAADIVVAGDSAGGGLALAMLVKLREIGAPMPRGLVLLSPWLDLTLSGESHTSNAMHPNPSRDDLQRAAGWYATAAQQREPLASPLFAELTGLPPMLIQVGGNDVLLSDATGLAERADAAGIAVRLTVAAGLWHVYQLSPCPEGSEALAEIARFAHQLAENEE
jgi:acetyl esterase/lipase